MAVLGIGTDVVNLERVKSVHDRHGKRFARRILAKAELEEYAQLENPVAFLAKRFAAKEACAKALGAGMRGGIEFDQFRVLHNDLGQPHLELSKKAAEVATELGVNSMHISISDERDFAIAMVVLES